MIRAWKFLCVCSLLVANLLAAETENWPCWRGPRYDGTSIEANIPTTWDVTNGTNVAWKTPLEAKGHSSPIVWGDRVFVTGCLEAQEQGTRVLLCFDRRSGKQLWQQEVATAPLEKKHDLNSYASSTPATDGKLVYVTFLLPEFASKKERTPGDMIVAAYNFNGEQVWVAKPGKFASVHGFCSSPVIFENLLIVNGDHDGDSYIVALDKSSGKQVWKIPRANQTRSYVTPIIREINGRTQMMLSGSKAVTSYDPRTGQEQWTMRGPTEQFVASLVYNGRHVFLTAGFPEHHILCVKPDGAGDVTDTHIVWRTTKACSYVPSPIVVGDYFLVVADNGIGTCFLADTGEVQWRERLGSHYSGSLVTTQGLVYFTADDGVTKVIRPGPKFDLVSENKLDQHIYSSAALSQGQILFRGEKDLICIGN
jgi:outer membrane protein assembly factor BamB